MRRPRLAQAIAAARARIDAVLAVPRPAKSSARQDVLRTELANAFEELAAAEEDLREQSDHLVAARRALETGYRRYQDLFEFMPDGYLVTDLAGLVREVNRAALAILATTPHEAIGRPIATFVAPFDRGTVRRELAEARRHVDRPHRDVDVTIQRRGREPLAAALTVAAISDEAGGHCGFRLLLRDVSDRRRAEEAARSASAAMAANAAKDAFLATLSHELRNPLNAIIGWCDILRTETVAPEQQPIALETIDRNARQLNRLVGDLLDVSRIAQEKLTFDPAACDLTAVVAAACESVRNDLTRRRQRLSAKLHDPGTVLADPARVLQIVSNLLSNAVKFTPAGGAIDLLLDADEREIQIVVRDSGIGIARELLPHVFERFWQGEPAPTLPGGGLGLGLPIARTLARVHGGDVSVDSGGTGRGTTFTVRLPLRRPDAQAAPERDPGACENRLLHGFHVLVVSPDHLKGAECARQLACAGATVRTAAAPGADPPRIAGHDVDALVVVVPASSRGSRLLAEASAVERRLNGTLPVLAVTPSSASARRWLTLPAEVELCVRGGVEPGMLPSRLAALAQINGWGRQM